MNIEQTPEWRLAREILEPVRAKRTGISHFQHVREGVAILEVMDVSLLGQQAFALHPLIQKAEDFARNLERLQGCDPRAVALAVEYRWVANLGVRAIVRANNWEIMLSDFPLVNQMLIADKVQNRKDFLTHFDRSNPEYAELDRYFNCWLGVLGVSEENYQKLVKII